MKVAFDVDRAGSIASTLCAIHCVVSGVLLGVLSSIGAGFIASESVEILFLSLAALFGVWALVRGWLKHSSFFPAILFAFGIGLLVFAHIGSEDSHQWGLSATGGVFLVLFHLLNHSMIKASERKRTLS
jgi:hypothetical protein